MAKKRNGKTTATRAAKADTPSRAAGRSANSATNGPEPKAAKADRKREKQLAKLEQQLVDARAVRKAADELVAVLQRRIAELRGAQPKPAAAGGNGAVASRAKPAARSSRKTTTTARPRTARSRTARPRRPSSAS